MLEFLVHFGDSIKLWDTWVLWAFAEVNRVCMSELWVCIPVLV